MNQKGIGVSNLPNLKYSSVCQNGIDFNIMTVGSHGLGKSSFINGLFNLNLLNTEIQNSDFHVTTCTIIENQFKTNISITEVDRIGDKANNEKCWTPIIKYLHDLYKDYLNKEQHNVRSLVQDKRIHICFYFLEPNCSFIKPVDLQTMKEISKYCNLIPVVSKSDFLNEKQKQECFDFLRVTLEQNSIIVFEEKCLKRGNISNFTPPFFIVCPDSGLNTSRTYPWGTLDIQNLVTNDLYRLRDQLINKNIIELIKRTEEIYDIFRATLLYECIDKQASKCLNKEMINCALSKEIENDEKSIQEMKERILEKKNRLNMLKQ